MKNFIEDPVLNFTAGALRVLRWGALAFTWIVLACAVFAILAWIVTGFNPNFGQAAVRPESGDFTYTLVLLVGGGGLFYLIAKFLQKLWEIVTSVGVGQALSTANAQRLRWMGFCILALEILAYPILFFLDDTPIFDIEWGLQLIETLLIVAFIFILARVFEHGAKMQDELEGTV